jgi:hypothetical protein
MAGNQASDTVHLFRRSAGSKQAWTFRCPAWHPQGLHTVTFSDKAHGGPDKALAAAKAARNEAFALFGLELEPTTREITSRSKSGLVGVSFLVRETKVVWEANWINKDVAPRSPGRQTKARFDIALYGFVEAWAMAVKTRELKTGKPFTPRQIEIGRINCMNTWAKALNDGILKT